MDQVSQTHPLHQNPANQHPATQSTQVTNKSLAAGFFGFVVVSTGTMGQNLNKVNEGEMTMAGAVGDAVSKGMIGGTTAATATAASATLTSGGVVGVAVTVASATAISYLIHKLIK